MSTCKTCGAPVVWAKTPNGKSMPVDREPSPKGNIVLNSDGTCTVVTAGLPGVQLYRSHFVTCPQANGHRKPRGRR